MVDVVGGSSRSVMGNGNGIPIVRSLVCLFQVPLVWAVSLAAWLPARLPVVRRLAASASGPTTPALRFASFARVASLLPLLFCLSLREFSPNFSVQF